MRRLPAPPLRIRDGLLHLANDEGSVDALLAALTRRPAWQAFAACRGRLDVAFVPGPGQPTAPAKALCAGCEVREPCLAFAMAQDPPADGVWGGTSAQERAKLRAGRAA